nr:MULTISPECIES: helix-turn-helix transcriptional regulator [Streptomyces]
MKLLRERAGLTRAELASRIGYGADLVASVESGRRFPQPQMIDKVDEVLGAGGVLAVMKGEVAQARYPAFFRDAARLEAVAAEVQIYAHLAVPGLLQTEEYARAVFGMDRPQLDEEAIAQRVAARLARQEIFSARPMPIVGFVIEEVVLRRPFGGREVLRGQLEHLLLVGQKRNVEIQVMPTAREDNAGVDGPFSLMVPRGGEQVAYLEGQGRSALIADRDEVHAIAARYGIIRAQALTPRESSIFIEKLLGEL